MAMNIIKQMKLVGSTEYDTVIIGWADRLRDTRSSKISMAHAGGW